MIIHKTNVGRHPTDQTDALGNHTTFTYDSNGNRLTQSVTRTKADGTKETLTTQYAYDDSGRVIKTVMPDGTFTQVHYNAIGKQDITTDALGRQTRYDYDDAGRLIKTTFANQTFESTATTTKAIAPRSKTRAATRRSSSTTGWEGRRRRSTLTLATGRPLI